MAKSVRMNVNNWTYDQFVQFTKAIQTGNNAVLFDLASLIIVGWDYDVDLSKPEPLMELGVIESGKVIGSIFDTINRAAEELSTEGLVVDFGKWNTRRFLEFDDARRDGNTRKAEKMLHEIVNIGDRVAAVQSDNGDGTLVQKDEYEPLTFEEGARAFKAVNEAYKKLVTGKG